MEWIILALAIVFVGIFLLYIYRYEVKFYLEYKIWPDGFFAIPFFIKDGKLSLADKRLSSLIDENISGTFLSRKMNDEVFVYLGGEKEGRIQHLGEDICDYFIYLPVNMQAICNKKIKISFVEMCRFEVVSNNGNRIRYKYVDLNPHENIDIYVLGDGFSKNSLMSINMRKPSEDFSSMQEHDEFSLFMDSSGNLSFCRYN